MFNVGSQLRKIRRKSNLTLDQLAVTSGVDRGTISRIELGHVSPRIDTISFLCEAMDTNLGYFFASAEPSQGDPPPHAALAPGLADQGSAPFLAPPDGAATAETDGYWPVPASLWHGMLEVIDRFEILVKNSRELILVQDRAGIILYVSPACKRILGLGAPQLVGRAYGPLIHPADRPKFDDLVRKLLPAANATGQLDCRLAHKDGSWRWISSRICNQVHNPSIQALVINSLAIPEPLPG